MLEQYMNDPKAIWTIFFATAALTGAGVDGLGRLMRAIYIRRRVLAITFPEVRGEYIKFERVKKGKGATWTKKEGDEGTATILSGDAAYPSNWGPVHAIDKNGFNLIAPTKDEPGIDGKTGKNIKTDPEGYRRFRIWDHLIYWRACRENDMEDLYSAQKDKDHWAVKLAPVAIILFIGLMGFMGFLLWKIMPLLEKGL